MSAARFEVLTAVLLKILIFWDVTLCRVVNSYTDVSKDRNAFIFGIKHGNQNWNMCTSDLTEVHSASFELLHDEKNSLFANDGTESAVKEASSYIYDALMHMSLSLALKFGAEHSGP